MRGRASERAARRKPKAKCAIRQRPHRAFRQSLEIGDNLTRNHLPLQVGGTLVLSQWTNDPVVLVLLHDVRAPTRDAGCHKDRRVLRHRNAHDEVRHSAWEVHVRMDVLVAQHDRLDFVAHVEPLLAAWPHLLRKLETPAAQDARAMVAILVDAMAKAHQFALLCEGALHPRIGGHLAASAVLIEVLEHFHGHLIGAAVQRTLERADAATYRTVHVTLCACNATASERTGVEIVLCVEDEADIHDARLEF